MVDLGFMNSSPFNAGKGISNPFASSPSIVKNNAPKQDLQKKLANPVASVMPNMSTPEGDAVGSITTSKPPMSVAPVPQAPMSTAPMSVAPAVSPSMQSLDMFKKELPTIPKFTPTMPGINAPTLGTQFAMPTGAENTQVQNMPGSVKADIKTQMAPTTPNPAIAPVEMIKQLTYDVGKGATDDQLISAYPEVSDPKLFSQLKYDIQKGATPEQIAAAYPELSANKVAGGGTFANAASKLSEAVKL